MTYNKKSKGNLLIVLLLFVYVLVAFGVDHILTMFNASQTLIGILRIVIPAGLFIFHLCIHAKEQKEINEETDRRNKQIAELKSENEKLRAWIDK